MINIPTLEEGRKEDGNRSIADKIIKRLHDLEKTIESNQGRWAWELLQNAKDSIMDDENKKVSVEIILDETSVSFKHNGAHFTEMDVRGLINQISSKEVEEGMVKKKTGKFGTGFLTTHLLSKVIKISGIIETKNSEIFTFAFTLDRDGKTTSELIPKIEQSWKEFQSGANKLSTKIDINSLNTNFTYIFNTEKQRQIARIGLDEFTKLIPYVLIFNPKIESVNIKDLKNNRNLIFKYPESNNISEIKFLKEITKIDNGVESRIFLLKVSLVNGLVQTAIEVRKKNGGGYELVDIQQIPKLFCDFPLIGTEKFHFPIVINSFYFNPTTERDGVWLKGSNDTEVEENKELINGALTCYKALVEYIKTKDISKIYNVVETKMPTVDERYFDKDWYQTNVQSLIREFLLDQEIINTPTGIKKSLKVIRIPDKKLNNEDASKLYKYYSELNPDIVCDLPDANHWKHKTWEDCVILNFERMINAIAEHKNIRTLFQILNLGDLDGWNWYNDVCKYIISFEDNLQMFENKKIIPNQYGDFCLKSDPFDDSGIHIDKINDEFLIDILKTLGKDWRKILLHPKVGFGRYFTKNKNGIAQEIISSLAGIDLNSSSARNAITQLFEWFEYNIEDGKRLFPELYRRRAEMFLNTISDKESLYKIMRSRIDLSTIANIASAIENDPEILNIIRRRQQDQQEEFERNEIGEFVEQLLKEVLEENGFQVIKNHVGSDLIISLNGAFSYDIEVKSISSAGFVKLTPTQALMASNNSAHYALCVVQKDGTPLTKDYVQSNARFVINIGNLVAEKVNTMNQLKSNQNQISNDSGEIGVIFENSLEFKYKVGKGIWSSGMDFVEFIEFVDNFT